MTRRRECTNMLKTVAREPRAKRTNLEGASMSKLTEVPQLLKDQRAAGTLGSGP